MAFRLQRWNLGDPAFEVRDGSSREIRGRISSAFKTFLDLMASQIEDQEQRQDAIDTELQATVETLEATVALVESITNDTATLAGQMNSLLTNYVPMIDNHETRLDSIEARLTAAGIP